MKWAKYRVILFKEIIYLKFFSPQKAPEVVVEIESEEEEVVIETKYDKKNQKIFSTNLKQQATNTQKTNQFKGKHTEQFISK